jgi:hypothetical protein
VGLLQETRRFTKQMPLPASTGRNGKTAPIEIQQQMQNISMDKGTQEISVLAPQGSYMHAAEAA